MRTDIHPTLGSKLTYFRKLRGLSSRALARAAGISASAVSGYERGKANPSYEHSQRLAEALGVHVAWLWDHTPAPDAPPSGSTEPPTGGDGEGDKPIRVSGAAARRADPDNTQEALARGLVSDAGAARVRASVNPSTPLPDAEKEREAIEELFELSEEVQSTARKEARHSKPRP
ncbi:MAG: helix-turn-helix domain-containing protein [Planctomycetota bacterium]|jgi:transcriptional regulator with XRE-family HTH domain